MHGRRLLLAASLVVSSAALVVAGSAPGVVEAVPSGFTDQVVADVGVLTTVEALPDGRVVVLEKNGRLIRIDDRDGSPEVTTLADFSVCSNSERGLLGFALDPAYVTSGFVYVYRTIASGEPGGCHNRVSRFSMGENGLDPGSERVLVDRISSVAGNHNGGDIEVGNDGYLYIAVGDAGSDPRGNSGSAGGNDAAQDRSLLNGKILRVDRSTGFAAPDNPFVDEPGAADCRVRGNSPSTPTTNCKEIFAYGLRNPYRFAFDPNTSATRFFVNDVGQGDREEVDEGVAGANYGWPIREGRCPRGQNPPCAGPTPGLIDPVTDYGREAGRFVTGGAFVPDGVWPAQYDGAYLVSDGAFGTTWSWTGGADLAASPVFLTASGPTDMAFVAGPGATELWYVQQNGEVRKVTPPPAPQSADSGPQRYDALPSPSRRFDTRALTPPAPIGAGRTRLIDIDAPAGASAAFVNVTLVRPQSEGAFATVWQPRTDRPSTSNVNAPAGANVANASIVPL
ncbi:MAG: PQQ-dependent sugar dehydrogenase, partial [Ilumatobacter sp.]